MVITLKFINLCNTATITHGNAKLHINYFDLLMYFLQVIIIMIILFFKYVYRFGTVLIQEILENYMRNQNIRQFLHADKTDFYLQFMSHYMIWSVYLRSICDSPGRIKVARQFVNGDVTYVKDVCLTI